MTITAKTVYIDCSETGKAIIDQHRLAEKIPGLLIHVGDPSPETLAHMMDGAGGVINGHTPMDAEFMRRHPSLRTITFLGTGASSYIDVAAAQNLGIEVNTIKGYGNRTNAEYAFGMILAAARNVTAMDREIRQGRWTTSMGMELSGKRLGVIGTGGVGQELIRIARAFGMEVVAWNRSPIDASLPCRAVPLETLLSSADVVSLHLGLNEDTQGFIGKDALALMKRTAIFVNVARGGLVDEQALLCALQEGRLQHAALDVFEQEPLPAGHPLTGLSNVTLTAHAAYKSEEAMTRLMVDGFDTFARSLLQ